MGQYEINLHDDIFGDMVMVFVLVIQPIAAIALTVIQHFAQ